MGKKGWSVMKLILHRFGRRWKLSPPFCFNPFPTTHILITTWVLIMDLVNCYTNDPNFKYILTLTLVTVNVDQCLQAMLRVVDWTWENCTPATPKKNLLHTAKSDWELYLKTCQNYWPPECCLDVAYTIGSAYNCWIQERECGCGEGRLE